MNYELAKKLKESGLAQRGHGNIYYKEDKSSFIGSESTYKEGFYIPTLSELIEACGDNLRWIKHNIHDKKVAWLAQGRPHNEVRHPKLGSPDIRCYAETPEEAVANLWLELQKK